MTNIPILAPLFAQTALIFVVWIVMYKVRLNFIIANKIHPQSLAFKSDALQILKPSAAPADNFNHQFEIPILFYLVGILIYVTGAVGAYDLWLMWAFVGLRAVHSYIQIVPKTVMWRFRVYLLSTSIVWLLWALLAYRLFA